MLIIRGFTGIDEVLRFHGQNLYSIPLYLLNSVLFLNFDLIAFFLKSKIVIVNGLPRKAKNLLTNR